MAHLSILDSRGNIISKKVWEDTITRQVTDFKNLTQDKSIARQKIKQSLINAVLNRKTNNLGVLFSGGLDSTLIAKILQDNNINFKCISVGFEGSSDLEFVKESKKIFNFDTGIKVISQQDLKEHLSNIIKIVGDRDVVKIEVAIVVYFGLMHAQKQNIKNIFAGGGSEEIFCGYQRHIESYKKGIEQLHKDSIASLISMYDRDLIRDFNLSKYFNINLLLPFLDLNLIEQAMSTSPFLKTDGITKKIILRQIAFDLGLDDYFSNRKRTAAQYGSKVSGELLKLAKKQGFRTKLEFIKNL